MAGDGARVKAPKSSPVTYQPAPEPVPVAAPTPDKKKVSRGGFFGAGAPVNYGALLDASSRRGAFLGGA